MPGPLIEMMLDPCLVNSDEWQRLHDVTMFLDILHDMTFFVPEAPLIHLHDYVGLLSPTCPEGLDGIICLISIPRANRSPPDPLIDIWHVQSVVMICWLG